MSKIYRIGVIGFAHMHINHLIERFAAHPQAELVACADTPALVPELRAAHYTRAWNLRHALDDLGVPKSYDDYQEMLEQEKIDIVICCAENAQHPAVVEACAQHGVHVIIEKPMAASLQDGLQMARTARAAGIELIVNWPTTWQPASHKAKQLIDSGAIGRVLTVKFRGGHLGPLGSGVSHPGGDENNQALPRKLSGVERGATWWHQSAAGGGVMLDYCCYGSLVARWLVGEPATGSNGNAGKSEQPVGRCRRQCRHDCPLPPGDGSLRGILDNPGSRRVTWPDCLWHRRHVGGRQGDRRSGPQGTGREGRWPHRVLRLRAAARGPHGHRPGDYPPAANRRPASPDSGAGFQFGSDGDT